MATLTQDLQDCIDACRDCSEAVNVCLSAHTGEEPMKRCLMLCLDCMNLTTACAQMMARQSDYVHQICGVCTDLCADS